MALYHIPDMATPIALYPPTLSPQQLSNLIFNIKDYQITHGMLLKYGSDAHSINAIPVGVSLFPSLFPRSLFEEARELQALYNKLYARVAEDEEWLFEVLEE
jgi:glutathione synthase